MTINTIEAPANAIYLSEFMSELPLGILNKGATGVGGTFLATVSPDPYIIAVPTIEIISNKMSQNSQIIGVYGDMSYKTFAKQVKTNQSNIKIFTTYNSLPKTVNWLKALEIDAYTEYKLLVDEYHKILSDYSYRDKAIDTLLEESNKFNYVTYLSATPIKPKFTPKILADLPYTEVKWVTRQIKLHRKKTNTPFANVVKIIAKYKANGYQLKIGNHVSHEAYFFVNSVRIIKDILDNANLTPDEVKIICGESDRNKYLLEDFGISKVHDPNKPFTFVTSKSFLGVDFYSDSGVIYVVSGVSKKNTLLDISTDITQIAGRIRNINNPFKDTIFHIYNTGVYELDEKEFQTTVENKVKDTLVHINMFNNKMDDLEKEAYKKLYQLDLDDFYIYYNSETNTIEFNELKKLNEEFNYEVIHGIYSSGLSIRQGYIDAGFTLEGNQEYEKIEDDFLYNTTSISYQVMLKKYVEILSKEGLSEVDLETLAEINSLDNSIKKAVDTLGISRIRSLKYVKKKINNEIYSQCQEVQNVIKDKLEKTFEKSIFYSVNECKNVLAEVYINLRLDKKAKGLDVLKYLPGSETSRKIEGKKVLGYYFE